MRGRASRLGPESSIAGEVRRLQHELLRRVELHPVRTWSPDLLVVFIAAMDLKFGDLALGSNSPALRMVRDDS